ncbi:hypothetical protein [uncultured Shewanella sp.]|uniref:hypothetical protein n=1 Tax=uncultured Shewanella sp. TaxID=173975 RepID=UPI00262346A1|nr:hypothetical protein [uncultured Shewanella sp.]
MQNKVEKTKKVEELTVAELEAVNGGSSWLGHLASFERHQNEMRFGYQTGGSGELMTCDRMY